MVFGQDGDVVAYGDLVFGVALVLGNLFLLTFPDRVRTFFSPSALSFNYVFVSFALGALAYRREWIIYSGERLGDYYDLEHIAFITTIFVLFGIAVLSALWVAQNWSVRISMGQAGSITSVWAAIGFGMMAIFSFVKITLPFLGGGGDFSILPRVMGSIAVTVYVSKTKLLYRVGVYFAITIFLAVTQSQDKRVVVFYLLTVLLLEASKQDRPTFSPKILLAFIVTSVVLVWAVLSMSISRGYGNLDPRSHLDSVRLVPTYLKADTNLAFASRNFEFTATYFHSYNAAEYILNEPSEITLGASYLRPFLVVIPRSILPSKPSSTFGIYTRIFFSTFRGTGGSFVPNMFAESFWNFHILGALAIFLILLVLNRLFNGLYSLLKAKHTPVLIVALTIYLFMPNYLRTGDLGILAAYGGLVFIMFWGTNWFYSSLKRSGQ